jgi:hypothetical protein
MLVSSSHHIDASEPDADGSCEYCYEYDDFEFTANGQTLRARCYVEEPTVAYLKSLGPYSQPHMLTNADICAPLVIEAVAYLRANGKPDVKWHNGGCYEPV